MFKYFQKKDSSQNRDKGKSRERAQAESAAAGKGSETATTSATPKDPILDDEDQAFLQRIVSEEGTAPPLPERPHNVTPSAPKDAQTIIMQGADRTPLPNVPDTPEGEVAHAIEGEAVQLALKDKAEAEERERKKKNNRFSWLRRSSSRSVKKADRTSTGASLHDAAQSLRVPGQQNGSETASKATADAKDGSGAVADVKKTEQEEMADVLEQLNLAAENNRVFSMSDESKDLLKKFNLVLKDLVNGVPTAFHDLESLLTNSDQQIQKTYKSLPPFLQELIEKLPEKVTGTVMGTAGAAAAEGLEGKEEEKKKSKKGTAEYLATGAATASKLLKVKIPSLKELVAKQGSVVALLRSVVAALRTRFPALMGMNAVWSVALFVLLFIFWYCHKRGREVRLENERKLTEHEMDDIRRRVEADPAWVPPPGWHDGTLTTRAPVGATVEEVMAGSFPEPEIEEPLSEGEADYAPGGSLAKAIENDEVKDDSRPSDVKK